MKRYAIYYAPHQQSPLWQFGSAVLGFDAQSCLDVDYPDHPLFREPDVLAWTAGPRRYGFHATLKAPFHLAPDHSAEDLTSHLAAFAAAQRPFEVDLKLAVFREFLALVTIEPSPALDQLASACVREFDEYRAGLTPADRERRHPERLTARQTANLDRWGYPFVFEEFRFHMTLTGELGLDDMLRFQPVLDDLFALVPPRTSIDGLALFRQDEREGRFTIARRFAFGPP